MFLLEEPLTNQAFRFFSSKGLRGQILAIFRGVQIAKLTNCLLTILQKRYQYIFLTVNFLTASSLLFVAY